MAKPVFKKLHEVRETRDPGIFHVRITADIDGNGTNEEILYGVVPGDIFGIAQDVAAAVVDWLGDGNPVTPNVPLTKEELRVGMFELTARQFRLGLIGAGRSLADVDAAIAAIANPVDRQKAEVEWRFSTEFQRLHPLVVFLSEDLGFTPQELDDLWTSALAQ